MPDFQGNSGRENREQNAIPRRAMAQEGAQGVLYVVYSYHGYTKIGRSRNVAARLKQIRCGHIGRLCLLRQFPGMGNREGEVHAALDPWRTHGEWFADTPLSRFMLAEVTGAADFEWPAHPNKHRDADFVTPAEMAWLQAMMKKRPAGERPW